MYISWTNTDIAPIRQLVGTKRLSLIAPSKSADVSSRRLLLKTDVSKRVVIIGLLFPWGIAQNFAQHTEWVECRHNTTI